MMNDRSYPPLPAQRFCQFGPNYLIFDVPVATSSSRLRSRAANSKSPGCQAITYNKSHECMDQGFEIPHVVTGMQGVWPIKACSVDAHHPPALEFPSFACT